MSFLLKIVEGPNKGAEAALVEGVVVTMGKGDACDIVLADASLPDTPMKLETSVEGVALDGELLEPLHVKTVGGTSFAVGPAAGAWGKLVWPAPEKAEEKPAEVPAAKAEAPKPKEEPPARKRSHGCLVALIVLLILFALLAGLVWRYRENLASGMSQERSVWGFLRDRYARLGGENREQAGVQPERTAQDAIAEIAARYGLEVTNVDGRLAVAGNLKTRAERLVATAEAYEAMPCVELALSDDETLKTAVEDTLVLIGETGLRVRAVTNRVAVLDGACSDLTKALMRLAQEVPKLQDIDGASVRRLGLRPQNASGEAVDENGFVVAGQAKPRAKTPVLPVCGILTTPYPCLVTRNGTRIMEGAQIGEWTVKKIDADVVVLENKTRRFEWRP